MVQKNNIQHALPEVKEREPLAPYTSLKVGGPARYFYVATTTEQLATAISYARATDLPFFVLGGGSNILIADHGFDGLVIKQENREIQYHGQMVTADSGVRLQALIRDAMTRSLGGIEYLIGVPGTIGGGVAGNVGTPKKGEWIDERLRTVRILDVDNTQRDIPKSQCDFSYRYSRFKYAETEFILSATFELKQRRPQAIQDAIQGYLLKRTHQPVSLPSAGSTFKNPENAKAWQLIDQVGLRGKKIGGAQVSVEHANFIVNTGQATAEDVAILISYVKQQVRDQLGIQLQEEVRYVGF